MVQFQPDTDFLQFGEWFGVDEDFDALEVVCQHRQGLLPQFGLFARKQGGIDGDFPAFDVFFNGIKEFRWAAFLRLNTGNKNQESSGEDAANH